MCRILFHADSKSNEVCQDVIRSLISGTTVSKFIGIGLEAEPYGEFEARSDLSCGAFRSGSSGGSYL